MKKIFALLTLVSMNAFAHEVSFKCDFSDITYINQFSLEAKNLQIEEGKFHNVEFDFMFRKAGFDVAAVRHTVTREGAVVEYAAGDTYRHATKRVFSVVKGNEVEYINLLIDVPPMHSSFIRLLDGTTYFGSCKSI